MRRTSALAFVAVLLAGCGPQLPPPSEQDVVRALATDVLAPMGDVLVVGGRSDCGSGGETSAAIPAALFAAFLSANVRGASPLDLQPHAGQLRIEASGASPHTLRAEHRRPVVAVSRVGIAGDEAVVCVEVFGVEERGFFLTLARDHAGKWSATSEVEAWRLDAPPWEIEAEELPDGEPYKPE